MWLDGVGHNSTEQQWRHVLNNAINVSIYIPRSAAMFRNNAVCLGKQLPATPFPLLRYLLFTDASFSASI